MMKALPLATLTELARAGAVRGYTLHGLADGHVLSAQSTSARGRADRQLARCAKRLRLERIPSSF
jgi:hypothetical protein